MKTETLLDYIDHWRETVPEGTWLRERGKDQFAEWSWRAAYEEVYAVAAWIEDRIEARRATCRAPSHLVEQLCLLGRGYAKTVMLCVLKSATREQSQDIMETAMRARAEHVNQGVDKHERIGVVFICRQPWTIENGDMTPTFKLRRDSLESRFGEQARDLAQAAAASGELLIHWGD